MDESPPQHQLVMDEGSDARSDKLEDEPEHARSPQGRVPEISNQEKKSSTLQQSPDPRLRHVPRRAPPPSQPGEKRQRHEQGDVEEVEEAVVRRKRVARAAAIESSAPTSLCAEDSSSHLPMNKRQTLHSFAAHFDTTDCGRFLGETIESCLRRQENWRHGMMQGLMNKEETELFLLHQRLAYRFPEELKGKEADFGAGAVGVGLEDVRRSKAKELKDTAVRCVAGDNVVKGNRGTNEDRDQETVDRVEMSSGRTYMPAESVVEAEKISITAPHERGLSRLKDRVIGPQQSDYREEALGRSRHKDQDDADEAREQDQSTSRRKEQSKSIGNEEGVGEETDGSRVRTQTSEKVDILPKASTSSSVAPRSIQAQDMNALARAPLSFSTPTSASLSFPSSVVSPSNKAASSCVLLKKGYHLMRSTPNSCRNSLYYTIWASLLGEDAIITDAMLRGNIRRVVRPLCPFGIQ